jgi:tetratricopeptide (TPR) repeat protein
MLVPLRRLLCLAALGTLPLGGTAVAQVPGINAYLTQQPPGQQALYAPYMERRGMEPFPFASVLQRARAEIDAGNFQSARDVLERGVRDWSYAEPRYLAAVAHSGLGELDAAHRYFTDALAVDSSHVAARIGLALTELRLGRSDAAAASLAELEARRAACAGECSNAAALERGVLLIRQYIGQPRAQ